MSNTHNSTNTRLVSLENGTSRSSDDTYVGDHRFRTLDKKEARSGVAGGFTNSFGVYQDYYAPFYLTNYTPSEIGWIGSVQLFLLCLCLPAGILFDAGYFHHIVGIGSLTYVFGQAATVLPSLLTQGIIVGTSLGFLFLPGLAITTHHFKRYRTLAMGIISSGSSCGGMLFPWLTNHLIKTRDFGTATRVAASICVGMLLANLLMRTRLPPKRERPEAERKPVDVKPFFREYRYDSFLFASFLSGLGMFFAVFYIAWSQSEPIFPFLNHTQWGIFVWKIAAHPDWGHVWGFQRISVFSGLQAILVFVMMAVDDSKGVIDFTIFYRFANGTFISVIGSCMTSLANSLQEVGARMGFAYLAFSFGMVSFSPIAGAIMGPHYQWNKAIGFHGTCLVVATILLIFIRMDVAKQRETRKV
ncbi:MFS general substrate transporter [Serendipita vermifera]|nr:MFS general substrate transporter [Serendipita vermifera]